MRFDSEREETDPKANMIEESIHERKHQERVNWNSWAKIP